MPGSWPITARGFSSRGLFAEYLCIYVAINTRDYGRGGGARVRHWRSAGGGALVHRKRTSDINARHQGDCGCNQAHAVRRATVSNSDKVRDKSVVASTAFGRSRSQCRRDDVERPGFPAGNG